MIKTIRSYSNQPICFVNNSEPSIEFTKLNDQYKNMFYLKGSLKSYQEMYKAAVGECKAVIILASSNKCMYSPDSDTILTTRLIEMSFPQIPIYIEISEESYIRFLGNRPPGKFASLSYLMWPQHLSGKCFFSSYLDSLICQIYYNPNLIDILTKLIGIDIPEHEYVENSKIHSIKLPNSYFQGNSTCTYKKVFIDLLGMSPSIIPIGVLSRKVSKTVFRPAEIMLINPEASTVISATDIIICVGGSSIDSRRTSGLTDQFSVPSPDISISRISNNSTECNDLDSQNPEALMSIMTSLQSRLETSKNLSEQIESRNEFIQSLYKEVEELKCESYENFKL